MFILTRIQGNTVTAPSHHCYRVRILIGPLLLTMDLRKINKWIWENRERL